MIDLINLEKIREEARQDKADLFDFYHKNWDKLVNELERIYGKLDDLIEYIDAGVLLDRKNITKE